MGEMCERCNWNQLGSSAREDGFGGIAYKSLGQLNTYWHNVVNAPRVLPLLVYMGVHVNENFECV